MGRSQHADHQYRRGRQVHLAGTTRWLVFVMHIVGGQFLRRHGSQEKLVALRQQPNAHGLSRQKRDFRIHSMSSGTWLIATYRLRYSSI